MEGAFHGTQRLPDISTAPSHTESSLVLGPTIPAHQTSCSAHPHDAAPLARASHTPLCDVVNRLRVMWGTGVWSLEQVRPSWAG